jgi:hypothetical protein
MRRWFAKGHRRWLRLVIPFAVVLAIVAGTGLVHVLLEPDQSDAAYLNPESGAGIGASRLRDALVGNGIAIERYTSSDTLLRRADQGDVTVFVPAPGFMHPSYLKLLRYLPATTRVVLVDPTGLTLANGELPADAAGSRWTTKAVAPDCASQSLTDVGAAAVYHTAYVDDDGSSCYHGAVSQFIDGATSMVLVGADDPFRNDRIGEYANAKLASLLLSAHATIAWLDLHRAEAPPPVDDEPTPSDSPGTNLGDRASPDPDFPTPTPGHAAGGGVASGGGGSNQQSDPLHIPAWLSSAVVLVLLAITALGLATGRRLGPPVSEPLPVVVRASETVRGRGRLYHKAKARGPALHTLRTSALARLLPALDLEPDTPPSTVVSAVVARTSLPPDHVGALLYGPAPADDAELVAAASGLQDLIHRALSVHKGESR